MEGHSECVEYLVGQVLSARQRSGVDLCASTLAAHRHPVFDVSNNLGHSPRSFAQLFLKHDTVLTIDRLLERSETSPDDEGCLLCRSVCSLCRIPDFIPLGTSDVSAWTWTWP